MKKFQIIGRFTVLLMAFALTSISMSSCGDDEPDVINGCTDPKGDTYNANATDDDGSCTYFNLFVGTWEGVFNCPGPLMAFFTSANLAITESASVTNDLVSVLVLSTALTTPVPTSGTITSNSLTITQSLTGISIDLLPEVQVPGPEIWNIDVNGTLTLSGDGSTLSGNVTIGLVAPALGVNLTDNCTYTATKQ